MPLTPPPNMRTREAILSFGPFGTGKSLGWATIADCYRRTNTLGHFHVLSTEWERAAQIAEAYPDFETNATIYECDDYGSLLEAAQKVRVLGTTDDWVVVDSIGNAQTWARDRWFNENMSKDYSDFRADGGEASEIGPAGWMQMDRYYKTFVNPNIVRFPGHKYAVAQADAVTPETDDRGRRNKWADRGVVKEVFGRGGLKPVGNKELAYIFRSVLLAKSPAAGDYELTTVKDSPGRSYLDHVKVAPLPMGFVHTFLMEVAGWTINE